MSKKELSPEQKMLKAIYGKPLEQMSEEEKREAYIKVTNKSKILKGE